MHLDPGLQPDRSVGAALQIASCPIARGGGSASQEMIKLRHYFGRLGNRMLQYASMHALARRTGYQLSAPSIDEFPLTKEPVGESVYCTDDSVYIIPSTHGNHLDYAKLDFDPKRMMRRESYWENIYNFDSYRGELRNIFKLPTFDLAEYKMSKIGDGQYVPVNIDPVSKRDLVISLRLGDFLHPPCKTNPPHRLLLHDYFKIVIANCKYERLFITSDEPFHPFVNEFKPYDPILVTNENPLSTMAFVAQFDKIAISQSTYSWWCAYLSAAAEIYYPIPKAGPWSVATPWSPPDLYLRPHTNAYKYVHYASGEIFTWKDAPGRRDHDDF